MPLLPLSPRTSGETLKVAVAIVAAVVATVLLLLWAPADAGMVGSIGWPR